MIPAGWRQLTLGEIAASKIVYGIVQAGPHVPEGVPYLKSSDVGGKIDVSNLQRTAPEIHARYRRSAVRPGDIVISLRGNTGETSIVPLVLPEANLTQGTARIAVAAEFDSDFIYHQIASSDVQRRIHSATKGSTFVEITLDELRKVEVLCPASRCEQRRVSEILSTWDRAIETVEALFDNARVQKRALMQALLTGKKRLPGFAGEWRDAALDELFTFRRGQGLSKDAVTPSGIRPCILYGELYTRYPEVIGEVVGRTNSNVGFPSRTGDILIPASTTTTGIDLANATAIMQSDVLLSGDINVLRPKDQRQSAPFFAYLLTHTMKHVIASRAQGITIVHLYGSDLKPLRIKVPEADEQHAIAEIILAADADIARIGAQAAAFRKEKSALMQQLLTGRRRVKVDGGQAA
jgi:type I restriction enzyme S subunit